MIEPIGELATLFRRELELCRLAQGELVALLTVPSTPPEYAAAATAGAGTLGAQTYEVSIPELGWEAPAPVRGMGAGVPALAGASKLAEATYDALARADLVIDLIPETIIHVPLRGLLQKAGCRILTVVEPPEMLERLFPPEGIKEAVLAMAERLAAAATITARSSAGTEISYDIRDTGSLGQYGFADEPGRWDHWPSALVVAYPVDGSAAGTVVLQPGDIVFPFKRHVEGEVRLRVEAGYVVEIAGGNDAFLLRDYLESWDEPEVFAASHIGLGMLPNARWSSLALYDRSESIGMDGRSARGSFLFSTGPNRFTGRLVEAHLDIPMHGCTVLLDEQPVIVHGRPAASEFELGVTVEGVPDGAVP
jgi:2,5-dihydroxypyridine 5,6-dioxygenase